MKKTIFSFAAGILSLTLYAQKASDNKIPAAVKQAFQKAHPNTTATWEKEGMNYEAGFKEQGEKMSCIISKNGSILETETVIASSQLPKPVTTYLNKHFPKSKPEETARIVKASGEVIYEAEINKKDYLFDEKGNFLRTAKD